MIYFKKLRWRNFLSTGNQFIEVDLAKSPSTLIIGSNGSGKSTLCHVVMWNKEYSQSGSISVDNEDISSLSQNERSDSGVFQSFQYPVG